MPNKLNEDGLTESLATELRRDKRMLSLFIIFLFEKQLPSALEGWETCDIQTQYRFSERSREEMQVGSRGRIDLLILLGKAGEKYAVAVEHKVWDEEKPSRLENYNLLLEGENFSKSWLFEIVRESDYDLSKSRYIKAVHRWRDLSKFMESAVKERDVDLSSAVYRLVCAMKQAGALVTGVIRRDRNGALQLAPAQETALESLTQELREAEVVAKMTRDRGLPLHIRASLKHWQKTFPGHWHNRIWIYSKMEPNREVSFFIHFIFHNANFTDFDFAARHFPYLAPAFEKLGYALFRGPAKGWSGKKRVQLTSPWMLDCRPKYFYAEEPAVASTAPPLGMKDLNAHVIDRVLMSAQAFEHVMMKRLKEIK